MTKRAAQLILFGIVLGTFPLQSNAFKNGITGYSGKLETHAGGYCTDCHTGGAVPNVVLTGPSELIAGANATYTLSISGGQSNKAGFNISASSGDLFISIASTSKLNGELKHDAPFSVAADSTMSWQFEFTAPNFPGEVTLYAAALSADGDGSFNGDGAAKTTLLITILDSPKPLPPNAVFDAPANAPIGVAVNVDASASSDSDGSVDRFLWDFGDLSPIVSGVTASHSYDSAGSYTITLAATDNGGYTSAIAHTVLIGDVVTPSPGEELYNTYCQGCHGQGGTGGAVAGPITGVSAAQIQNALNTIPNMQGLVLSDNDIQLIATYLATSGGTPPPRPTDGPGLYSLLCAGCHGADGGGGAIAKGITGAPFIMIEDALTNIGAMQAIVISDNEIQLVATFLLNGGNVSIPSDGAGLYQVFCGVCHGDGGHGGKFKAVTGAPSAMIASALNQQTWMQDLSLNNSQINAIAGFLSSGGSPPLPSDGAGLYGVFCAVCHGADGRGGKYKVVTGTSTSFVQNALSNVSLMRALNVNATQRNAITNFLAAGGDGDKPVTGAGLYHVYCETCHGVNGNGGPEESVRGASASSISSEINSNSNMSQLSPYLTSSEISLISSFLRGGQ